ncbi:hypothetical protein TREMEDRAFT_70665 [Tremella mesenterica DSM 1558]|uniref:uncharacterized protein n=1 Tax=Tremella mesenterica (strain ATCC 24925 / CBS 8224 / DSM 1558 / NBRC 9311 / NRRL Y-6157 / RJB 2259-6 / UBC 559-6) TaxID=578456 RepID=UPI0003F490FE|nr:uncharacterized protein TREMEDRAFT_70665 [Tremella mesenterica DSM 1558]EIW72275.1 hypothetical protein TREMEDRAFT_70665 [Tremella mesenterica DSM 1558]
MDDEHDGTIRPIDPTQGRPPPLPPRKVSQSPTVPPPSPPVQAAAVNLSPQPVDAASKPSPPPLPPRSKPAPISVVQTALEDAPKTNVSVSVIPATPPSSRSPASPTANKVIPSAQLDVAADGGAGHDMKPVVSLPEMSEANKSTRMVSMGDSIPPVPSWVPVAFLGIAAYTRSCLLIAIALGFSVWTFYGSNADGQKEAPQKSQEKDEGNSSVDWINHTLHVLFPLISTEVLTPFIDLLEDALMEQVPPVVTSVRLASPSLGRQPLQLTSLKALSDEEWFAALSEHPTSQPDLPLRGHKKGRSSLSSLTPSSLIEKASPRSRPRSGSSASRSSSSMLEGETLAGEMRSRRKRDSLLRRLSGRDNVEAFSKESDPHHVEPSPPISKVHRLANALRGRRSSESQQKSIFSGLPTSSGGPNFEPLDDDATGQYVNYQVSFTYSHSAPFPSTAVPRKGMGLHVLAYFGIGIAGLKQTEAPVYIDILSLKGTINLRLLLSATPPFVRTGTFFFPKLPDFDISAKPLVRSAFNAFNLPLVKPYVMKSIVEVAQSFVAPRSYTLDVDRLLLGREASYRLMSVGVLQLIIHGAKDLPKTDTLGTCDPYVSVGMTKFHKPLYATRTITNTLLPQWDETANILVPAEAVRSGEGLRLSVCDSDRLSSDDSLGVVTVDLTDLVENYNGPLKRRLDPLRADNPGMKVQGSLEWSIRFCPLWQISPEELEERLKQAHPKSKGEPKDVTKPWWITLLEKLAGEVPEWEKERKERRKEVMEWFSGAKEREEAEVVLKPNEKYRSGILQFHIHQASDLEVESLDGTYSQALSPRLSAAGGRSALEDVVNRTSEENPDPPSAYVEVHLNDQVVYRTRTKEVTPEPYYNAVSERFVRNWTSSRIKFVVRDSRDREHDPIIGLVSLPLPKALSERSQITRWYPLIGGLGWGLLRISLLWKPVEINLPPTMTGYDISTLHLLSLSSTEFIRVDRLSLTSSGDKRSSASSRFSLNMNSPKTSVEKTFHTKSSLEKTHSSKHSIGSIQSFRSIDELRPVNSSETSLSQFNMGKNERSSSRHDGAIVEEDTVSQWDFNSNKMAIRYRHTCSLVLTFKTKSQMLKKSKTVAIAILPLYDMVDDEDIIRTIPIYKTTNVELAVKSTKAHLSSSFSFTPKSQLPTSKGNSSEGTTSLSDEISTSTDAAAGYVKGQKDRQISREGNEDLEQIGWVTISFKIIPGISKIHKRFCKKDLRFMKAYEAWEAAREEDNECDYDVEGEDDEEDEEEDGSSEANTIDLRDDEEMGSHNQALHKKHKGIFQLKIARTGKLVADKISASVRSSGDKDSRPRGTDVVVEKEGTSRLG